MLKPKTIAFGFIAKITSDEDVRKLHISQRIYVLIKLSAGKLGHGYLNRVDGVNKKREKVMVSKSIEPDEYTSQLNAWKNGQTPVFQPDRPIYNDLGKKVTPSIPWSFGPSIPGIIPPKSIQYYDAPGAFEKDSFAADGKLTGVEFRVWVKVKVKSETETIEKGFAYWIKAKSNGKTWVNYGFRLYPNLP